jgi:D-arabinose 1-dehydrogenase-like Zn-dependent alcohol dehydrogenase
VVATGKAAGRWKPGERVGIPWLGWTCGECEFCVSARENLCVRARFTGCHLAGGYAEYALADERFCLPIPERYSLPSFPYSLLWGERRVESVANLTREDGARFMDKARSVFLKTHITAYPLDQANAALDDLRHGRFSGAAVLIP